MEARAFRTVPLLTMSLLAFILSLPTFVFLIGNPKIDLLFGRWFSIIINAQLLSIVLIPISLLVAIFSLFALYRQQRKFTWWVVMVLSLATISIQILGVLSFEPLLFVPQG